MTRITTPVPGVLFQDKLIADLSRIKEDLDKDSVAFGKLDPENDNYLNSLIELHCDTSQLALTLRCLANSVVTTRPALPSMMEHFVQKVIAEYLMHAEDLYEEINATIDEALIRTDQQLRLLSESIANRLRSGRKSVFLQIRRPADVLVDGLPAKDLAPENQECMLIQVELCSVVFINGVPICIGPPDNECQGQDEAPAGAVSFVIPSRASVTVDGKVIDPEGAELIDLVVQDSVPILIEGVELSLANANNDKGGAAEV